MKKTLYIIASAIFLVASCQKNEITEEGMCEKSDNFKILKVGRADRQSRVGFYADNTFYWHKGDRIGIITSAGLKAMDLYDEYDKQPVGLFYGDFQEGFGDYVIYPYGNHRIENGLLTYILPSSYIYTSIEDDANSFNPPMLGRTNGAVANMNHLASFIKISVTDIPAGGDDMKFILKTDKRITGEFTANLAAEIPVIVTDASEGNIVTITFSNYTTITRH